MSGIYEEKIKDLLAKMTLEEKVGQLRQCGPSLVGAFEVSFEELLDMMFDGRISKEEFDRLMGTAKQDFREEALRAGRIGSYNGIGDAKTVNRLQKIAVEETRLGIPLLFGYDVIHGFQTVTPIPLAESCAWDEDLWERTGRLAAKEATAGGVHMTFAPMVDVAKDARWGRVSEGAGEDVLLNGLYGAAKVRGFQGEDLSAEDSMAACVKHFAAYGAVEAGRDYNRVDMSTQKLFEEYLPSYEACVRAGARAIMPAFNDISGIPCSVNRWLLTDILRNRWGFDGMTISDANAIAECVAHGIAADKKEAAAQALEAGMDMDMTSDAYHEYLVELVTEGRVPMEALDRAVADILRVKFELGLFEKPYRTSEEREKASMLLPKSRTLAREAAVKSIVLLKNENQTLPLKREQKIVVFGELAGAKAEMLGAWSIGADGETCVSLTGGLDAAGISYEYYPVMESGKTGDGETDRAKEIETALEAAEHADVILCALGEHKEESGEASSRASITISDEQQEMFDFLVDTGKPVVAILFNGRPLAIPQIAKKAAAVVEAWHLGAEAGNAITDILYGKENPSGKLTTTFPYTTGQCPMYYAHMNTGRPGGKSKFTSKYLDTPLEPVYPFGFGLSYTRYEYSDLQVEEQADRLQVTCQVKNVGDVAGCEIAQCYIRDMAAKRVRPVRQLTAYQRLELAPGEEKQAVFEIEKQALGYYTMEMEYLVEPGEFKIFVGGNSVDCKEAVFELKEG